MKLVYIEWLDHCSHLGWQSMDELGNKPYDGLALVKTVGFLLGETKKTYLVASHVDVVNSNAGDSMSIIKKAVIKFKVLRGKI